MGQRPILGNVACTKGCGGSMAVRQSPRGRGGQLRYYGHCGGCGKLEQRCDESTQAALKGFLAGESLPIEAPAEAMVEDFDPETMMEQAPVDTCALDSGQAPGQPRRGKGWVVLGGVLALAAAGLGLTAVMRA